MTKNSFDYEQWKAKAVALLKKGMTKTAVARKLNMTRTMLDWRLANPPMTQTCAECGKTVTLPYGAKRKKFCSASCQKKYAERPKKAIDEAILDEAIRLINGGMKKCDVADKLQIEYPRLIFWLKHQRHRQFKCKQCGKVVTLPFGSTKNPSFCSAECKKMWRQSLQTPKRQITADLMIRAKDLLQTGMTRYAVAKKLNIPYSSLCWELVRQRRQITCQVCGRTFMASRRAKNPKYCSVECANKVRYAKKKAERALKRQSYNRRLICQYCGQEYTPKYKANRSKYCSEVCKYKASYDRYKTKLENQRNGAESRDN